MKVLLYYTKSELGKKKIFFTCFRTKQNVCQIIVKQFQISGTIQKCAQINFFSLSSFLQVELIIHIYY